MSDLIVIAFPDDAGALRARAELAVLQRDLLVGMEDVAVVTRGPDGQVQLHQAVELTAAGPMAGTLWGPLMGLLFLDPLLGAASGALADLGIPDDALRAMGASLDHGGAALAVRLRKVAADQAAARLAPLGGRVMATPLPADLEERLRARLAPATAPGAPMPPLPDASAQAAPAPGLAGSLGGAPAAASAIPGTHAAGTEP